MEGSCQSYAQILPEQEEPWKDCLGACVSHVSTLFSRLAYVISRFSMLLTCSDVLEHVQGETRDLYQWGKDCQRCQSLQFLRFRDVYAVQTHAQCSCDLPVLARYRFRVNILIWWCLDCRYMDASSSRSVWTGLYRRGYPDLL